ncbi:aldo keto related protein [Cyclospora cayetanensis]|uniref:Aldo keto related protein n=1 Tax=Cyclospora cayetanensis TaxID=88456 RepID=A0A1D3CZU2_9EIME|nr:aldo keto related protein [Cyclospora cayetanensis]
MGGPQLLSQLPDEEAKVQPPIPQSDFMKWGKQPIWSGGTYWENWPQPLLAEKVAYFDRENLAREVRGAAGALDDPSDEGVINLRLWRERLDEGLPGEYFAVKEQQLFGWDTHTVDGDMLRDMTPEERQEQHHMDWHLCWKGGKVHRVPTTDAMKAFYNNRKATSEVIHKNFKAFKDLTLHREQLGELVPELWNRWDYDLIARKCKEKHGIDINDPQASTEELFFLPQSEGLARKT